MLDYDSSRYIGTWFRDVVYSKRYEAEYFVMITEASSRQNLCYECLTPWHCWSLYEIYQYDIISS